MQYVTVQVVELWDGNFDSEVQKHSKLPWVVSFCGATSVEDGEEFDSGSNCPTLKTKRKLAGMLVIQTLSALLPALHRYCMNTSRNIRTLLTHFQPLYQVDRSC